MKSGNDYLGELFDTFCPVCGTILLVELTGNSNQALASCPDFGAEHYKKYVRLDEEEMKKIKKSSNELAQLLPEIGKCGVVYGG